MNPKITTSFGSGQQYCPGFLSDPQDRFTVDFEKKVAGRV
jgi:hypothetical protein